VKLLVLEKLTVTEDVTGVVTVVEVTVVEVWIDVPE
jgi:hypothetical protein